MKLLVFAHRGEAQIFLEKLDFSWKEYTFGGAYTNPEYTLLITGEGLQNATEVLSQHLTQNTEIKEVINLGICGALSEEFQQYDVFKIRTVYGFQQFKSFSSQVASGVDCLSHPDRVTENEKKKKLKTFAPLIDRELWGIASVCKRFKLPWNAYKIVSDVASDNTQCLEIREEAALYSTKLFEFFHKSISPLPPQSPPYEEDILKLKEKGLYFTFSLENKIKKILSMTSLEDISQVALNQIFSSDISAKNKTLKLIDLLEEKIDPVTYQAKRKIKKTLSPFQRKGLKVSIDPTLESKKIKIETSLENFEEVKKLLSDFPAHYIQELMDGDHV